jgi:hypothetical protein
MYAIACPLAWAAGSGVIILPDLTRFFDSWRRGDFAALADRLRIGRDDVQ